MKVALATAGVLLVFAWPAAARETTLLQVIEDLDCSHVTYPTGVGEMNDPDCDLFAPNLTNYKINDQHTPILYGAYDAVHAVTDPATNFHQLRIEFAGRVFVLGVDAELTVNGNAWKLDLANWNETHSGNADLIFVAGNSYEGKIISVLLDSDGTTTVQVSRSAEFEIEIPLVQSGEESPGVSLNSPNTGWLATARNNPLFAAGLVMVGLVLIIFYILIFRRYKGRRE